MQEEEQAFVAFSEQAQSVRSPLTSPRIMPILADTILVEAGDIQPVHDCLTFV